MNTKLFLAAATGSLCAMAVPTNAADLAINPGDQTSSHHYMGIYGFDEGAPVQTVRFDDDEWDNDDRRRYRNGRRNRVYDNRGRYVEPRRLSRRDRIWRGRDGRYYCRRDNGTTGLVIGAGVGALLGRTIDTRGDRTVGTLLGGALGAVLGRELDREKARCR